MEFTGWLIIQRNFVGEDWQLEEIFIMETRATEVNSTGILESERILLCQNAGEKGTFLSILFEPLKLRCVFQEEELEQQPFVTEFFSI